MYHLLTSRFCCKAKGILHLNFKKAVVIPYRHLFLSDIKFLRVFLKEEVAEILIRLQEVRDRKGKMTWILVLVMSQYASRLVSWQMLSWIHECRLEKLLLGPKG